MNANQAAIRMAALEERHPFEELTPEQQAAVYGLNGTYREPDEMVAILRAELPGTDIATFPSHVCGNRSHQILRIEGAWLHLEPETPAGGGLYRLNIPEELLWQYEVLAREADDLERSRTEMDALRS